MSEKHTHFEHSSEPIASDSFENLIEKRNIDAEKISILQLLVEERIVKDKIPKEEWLETVDLLS